jgi:hypothetical protein
MGSERRRCGTIRNSVRRRTSVARRLRALALSAGLCALCACSIPRGAVHRDLQAAASSRDALATTDALEALIAEGTDTPADRTYAYEAVRSREEDTAGYTYARAVVTGRVVQQRGLLGAAMVPDVERYARRSRELDPDFRDGAATRVLGTLYVVAPASLLAHGDSEQGLELLEGLVRRHPEVAANHLRVAEAYVALGDAGPAAPHLCALLGRRSELHPDEQILLDRLVHEVGDAPCAAGR